MALDDISLRSFSSFSDLENVIHYQKMRPNTSKYFEWCWIKYNATLKDPELPIVETNYVYSETASIIAGIGFALESIIGTILNLLVIIALGRNADFRKEYLTPSIVSIAFTDLLYSVFSLPILSLHYFTKDMPAANCNIFSFFIYGLWLCSACNLLGIAILRCAAIYFPAETDGTRFRRTAKLTPIIAWIIAFLPFVPVLFGKLGRFELDCETRMCRYMNMDSNGYSTNIDLIAVIGNVVIIMGILMFVLNGATYAQVSKLLKQIIKQMKDANISMSKSMLEKERRLGNMMAMISILFFLVYCPTLILFKIEPEARVTKPTATILCLLVNASIGTIDPLVYMICQKKYRKEMKMVLESIFTCKNPFYTITQIKTTQSTAAKRKTFEKSMLH